MLIVYEDDELERTVFEASFSPPSWGADAVKRFRKIVQHIDAAQSRKDLLQLHSIDIEKRASPPPKRILVRIGDRLFVSLSFRKMRDGHSVIIEEAIDYL
ncbi:hypothetical protein [Brachybacterium sp. UNK5269]|uniref:hypothetical protein n=1 Tax=Brachybacterium sp. UNK5269 TaxID=3408576 RepID=UPI003BB079F3